MRLALTSYSDDNTQICSCHNVSKGDVAESIKSGTCKTLGEVKSCTKAGSGCGGCMPLVQSIFTKTMLDMGQEVSNHCMFLESNNDLANKVSVYPHSIFAGRPV